MKFNRKKYLKEYRKTAAYRESDRKAKAKHRAKHHDRQLARQRVYMLIRKGTIKRPKYCSCCHVKCIPHAHHPDYKNPFEVIFLCSKCHMEIHGKKVA